MFFEFWKSDKDGKNEHRDKYLTVISDKESLSIFLKDSIENSLKLIDLKE